MADNKIAIETFDTLATGETAEGSAANARLNLLRVGCDPESIKLIGPGVGYNGKHQGWVWTGTKRKHGR